MANLKYSIVIPAYNVENHIEKCIDSILNQTYKNFEIIVVDNCSNDGTLKKLKQKKYLDKIIIVTKDGGLAAGARNAGIERASGDYLMFLDSDDWWDVDLLEKINEVLEKNKVDIIGYSFKFVYDNKESRNQQLPVFTGTSGLEALRILLKSHLTFDAVWPYAYKLSFWKKHNISFTEEKYHEDFGLVPYVIAKADSMMLIDYIGYNYYQSDVGYTRSKDANKILKRVRDTLFFVNQLKNELYKIPLDNELKDLLANYLLHSAVRRIELLPKKERKSLYKELKQIRPFTMFSRSTIKSKIKYYLVKLNVRYYKIFIKL